MDLDELDCYIKTYDEKIKPLIEGENYDEASKLVRALFAIFNEQLIRNGITFTPITHLGSLTGYTMNLCKSLEKEDNIKECQKRFEVYLKQYQMRLEALANSQS